MGQRERPGKAGSAALSNQTFRFGAMMDGDESATVT
jgi:hypothetical protein